MASINKMKNKKHILIGYTNYNWYKYLEQTFPKTSPTIWHKDQIRSDETSQFVKIKISIEEIKKENINEKARSKTRKNISKM